MKKFSRRFYDYVKTKNKFVSIIFAVIWAASFAALVNSIILRSWVKIGLAFAALILYFIPAAVTIFVKVKIPSILEITYLLFIFASLVLGEVFAFYGPFPWWDVVLHFLSGFVLAGIGFFLINLNDKPVNWLILLFSFCFAITLGVIWECVEFSFDMMARTDAQKDAHIHSISTITMQRDGGNQPVRIDDIVSTDIHLANGEIITVDEGYLDIGLMDTMKDIFVNIAGALVFVFFDWFYIRDKKHFRFIDRILPAR